MPPTRKTTRGAAAKGAASAKGQSTLSFNNRVSKAGPVKGTGKDKDVELDSAPIATPPPTRKELVEADEEEEEEEEAEAVVEAEEAADDKPEAEVRAVRITDAQIRRYWKGVEEARLAKRVHQEDLGLGEKVLRYFDISSQYGVSFCASHTTPLPLLWGCWKAVSTNADIFS